MLVKTELSKHQFKDLYTFLTVIKPLFQDFSIVRGQFRSSNNDRMAIVETHFRCFDGMDFAIGDIKSITKELSGLAKSPNITIALEDSSVIFSDGKLTIPFENLERNSTNNPFIDLDEMNRIWTGKIGSTKMLMKQTLPKIVVSRIRKVSTKFHKPKIILKVERGDLSKGNIYIERRKEYTAELEWVYTNRDTIDFLTPMKKGALILIPRLSYAFNKSDLIIEIYLCRDQNSVGIKHKARIGNISVATYSLSLYGVEEPDTKEEG